MTDALRIKSSRSPYRRAGLAFSSTDWTEVNPSQIGPRAAAQLAADGELKIEARIGDDWVAMSAEDRQQVVEHIGALTEEDWVEIAAAAAVTGSKQQLQVDPGILAKANDWDALLAVISLHQADLEGLKLWPFEAADGLVVALINGLGEAEAVIADRDAEIVALNGPEDLRLAAFRDALAKYDAALIDPDPVAVRHASGELSDVLDALVGEIARGELTATHNPSDVQQGAGTGDGAGPGDWAANPPPAEAPEPPPAKSSGRSKASGK